jgi:hypothetical protein
MNEENGLNNIQVLGVLSNIHLAIHSRIAKLEKGEKK